MNAYLLSTPLSWASVHYPDASWARSYSCPLWTPIHRAYTASSLHSTSTASGWHHGSPGCLCIDSQIQLLQVALMTWSYLPHASSPKIPFLRFLSSSRILHYFPLVIIIFQFSKGMLSSTFGHCKQTPFLFLRYSSSSLHLPSSPGQFSAQCLGLSFHVFTSWKGFQTTLSVLLCAPIAPQPYPSLSYSLAVVLNKEWFWHPPPPLQETLGYI